MREWDQRFFVPAIDLQNLAATRIENIRDRADVLSVRREYFATFQLKGVIPAFLWCRQITGWNFDFGADVLFGFRNRVDSLKLHYAASMLPAKQFDFRFALRGFT